MIADGAEWIWQETGKYFASRVQILDFYHAREHLWNVGRAWQGDKTEAEKLGAKAWVKQQKERLVSGKASEVIAALQAWEPKGTEACDVKRRELGYFQPPLSRGRLNYPN